MFVPPEVVAEFAILQNSTFYIMLLHYTNSPKCSPLKCATKSDPPLHSRFANTYVYVWEL